MSGHTPGPWTFFVPDAGWYGRKTEHWAITVDDRGTWICEGPTWNEEFQPESHANGRLMAAAPELLAANVRMVDALNVAFHIKPEWDDERIYDEMPTSAMAGAYFANRAAIAKATGAQP